MGVNQRLYGRSLGLLIVMMLLADGSSTTVAPQSQCDQAPAHAQPADTHYRITIAGEPDLFLPGELYTVSLQGVDVGQGPTPFIGFTIWAEIDEEVLKPEDGGENTFKSPTKHALGAFQAYDAQTKPHEMCKPAVNNATAHPKTEIQQADSEVQYGTHELPESRPPETLATDHYLVICRFVGLFKKERHWRVIWSAPTNVSDICIRVCARASPPASPDTVSVLARKMCPAQAAPANFVRQPPIVEPCCACDEAKYEVVFEGLWSSNTHPREFPPESARAHFGDVIGASHTAQYRVWQEGRVASSGLRRLADDGATTALEKELKAESDHIRTIIKARGISWQQVAGSGTPNTFAVFRVDAKHHLVSLAAKLAPSPDWIVGVSALELCNPNCTWTISATLPLYPYDAGTDNGATYTARRQPTVPAAPVRALRPDWPKDSRSPLYSTANERRPFGRLRFTRLRLYEKSCDTGESSVDGGQETSANGGSCATYPWGGWGACSVSCGVGRASRQRHYVWPARAYADACRIHLTDYRRCTGPRMHCRAVSQYEPDPASSNGPCAVSPWTAWSPCEGCGVRARTRHYVGPRAHKRCHVGFRASTVLSQAIPCEAGPCHKPPGMPANSSAIDWFFKDKPQGECRVTPWSEWSPCSARCGRGRRLRTRIYLTRDFRTQQHILNILLDKWNRYFTELQNLEYKGDNYTSKDPETDRLAHEHIESCQFTLTQQEALCDGEDQSCGHVSPEVCKLPLQVGPCRAYSERWFYDAVRDTCEPFGYTGCGGNANNFPTKERCSLTCKRNDSTLTTTTSTMYPETTTKKMKATPSNADNEVIQNDIPTVKEDVNCESGPWLGWSACVGDCHVAVKLNYRLVLRPASGDGKTCRRLMKSRTCRPEHCRKLLITNSTTDFTTENYEEDD